MDVQESNEERETGHRLRESIQRQQGRILAPGENPYIFHDVPSGSAYGVTGAPAGAANSRGRETFSEIGTRAPTGGNRSGSGTDTTGQ